MSKYEDDRVHKHFAQLKFLFQSPLLMLLSLSLQSPESTVYKLTTPNNCPPPQPTAWCPSSYCTPEYWHPLPTIYRSLPRPTYLYYLALVSDPLSPSCPQAVPPMPPHALLPLLAFFLSSCPRGADRAADYLCVAASVFVLWLKKQHVVCVWAACADAAVGLMLTLRV